MPKRDTSKRRPRCLRLFCQWAAMYEVDIEIVRRDGRQQYGQLEALAWELVHGGEEEEEEDGEDEGEGDEFVSRLLVATVAAAVEECMQSKIAKALGWLTTTTTRGQTATVFKPVQERVWPAWTKGWLRADWDGSLREPTERDKRAIARWWAATQKQQKQRPKRCRRDEVDDGVSDAGASDVDAAAQSHSARTGREGQRGGGGGPRREEEHRRMLLDQLLQNLYPGETDLQDDVMQALLFGIGNGDGDWTRYDWLS